MHKCHYRQFLLTLGVGLLFFAGVAQAQSHQGETNFQSIETKADENYLQPWHPDLNADQEGKKGALQEERRQSPKTVNVPIINKPNSKHKNKKAGGVEKSSPKSDSSGHLLGKYGVSTTQNKCLQIGGVGGLPTIQRYGQSPGHGSSFLDGFFLESLQHKGIGRTKETKEKEFKDDLPKKAKKAL